MKILSSNQVMALTGLSHATIWRYEQTNTFPKRRQLGKRRVGWVESEVLAWLESRPTTQKSEVTND